MRLDELRDLEKLHVYKSHELAGVIERTRGGCSFFYRQDYLTAHAAQSGAAVSFSLPLRETPYRLQGDNLHAFFAGLLPEGRRLEALRESLKTSPDDMFTLLAALGDETTGDVFVRPESNHQSGNSLPDSAVTAKDLSSVSFADLFEQSIHGKTLAERNRDFAVAGVQPKISDQMISFPLSIAGRDKRYILKLTPERYPGIIRNEHFFMETARACGLPTARTQVVKDAAGHEGLLVERFDRRHDGKNSFIRFHQEDACQFLDRYPHDKYRLAMREILEGILQLSSAPLVDSIALLRLVAFSYLIANGDLHGKNISLLVDPRQQKTFLSPAYDLLSTLPYGDESMALKFEGQRDNLHRSHFIAAGERVGLRRLAVQQMLDKLSRGILPWIDRLEETRLAPKKVSHLRRTMKKRLHDLATSPPDPK
ncbi:MAG: HipA domain-containing protein [bacterium]|nr:HipA domain-containing protein [bacterium]